MAFEPVTTAALFGLSVGLIEIIKQLITKFSDSKKEKGPELSDVDEKVDACAIALAKVASALERQADTLDRLETRLEKVSDNTTETRLKLMSH